MAVVERFNQAFGSGDVDAILALMTDDCIFENTFPAPDGERVVGQAAMRQFCETFFSGTDKPRFSTEEIFAAGDRVITRWRFDWGEAIQAVTCAGSTSTACATARLPRSSPT